MCTFLSLATAGALIGCQGASEPSDNDLSFAVDTRVYNSGLLDVLVPAFEEQTDYDVTVVPDSAASALEAGRAGDVDVMLTSDPAAEERFVADGYGVNRQIVMRDGGEPALARDYYVMQVEPGMVEGINAEAASVLIEFLISDEGQELIRNYLAPGDGTAPFVPQVGEPSSASPSSLALTSDIHSGLRTMFHSRLPPIPSTS